jgi:hypothetical protein
MLLLGNGRRKVEELGQAAQHISARQPDAGRKPGPAPIEYKTTLDLSSVAIKPFLDRPNALWALALNFKSHIAETGLVTSRDYPHHLMSAIEKN